MSNASNIAKISVLKFDSTEQFLYDLDKNKDLQDIIIELCDISGVPISKAYGLKIIDIHNSLIETYLTEKNFQTIKHNDCLKIVFSIEHLLNNIVNCINDPQPETRSFGFDTLAKLAFDPAFIDELVRSGKHHVLLNVYEKNDDLKDKELVPLLATICHLFQKGLTENMSVELLQKTIRIVKNHDKHTTVDHVLYALSILQKILTSKNQDFLPWKETVIKDIPITCLIPYIRLEDGKKLHYGVLLLINTIIKSCKGEQKKILIKEMNLAQNREDIYKFVIAPGNLDKKTEHELYVVQTYILSLYEEALNTAMNLNDNSTFKREEFELPENDVRRLTVLLDFDEIGNETRTSSFENLLTFQQAERLSLASVASDRSQNSRKSSTVCSPRSQLSNFNYDIDSGSISYLTLEALRHYKSNHKKNFCQSQIEERVYEPGIFVTSERVVKMLGEILHIGVDPPDGKSVSYQPIVFQTSPKMPFFLELFSRCMWLLSRTRREMKVSTIEDYPKLMRALRKQIKMVLIRRPVNFKSLTNDMSEVTFDAVLRQWQMEKDEEMRQLINNHPCIQQLKETYQRQNEPFLRENRMNVLKKGEYFPKIVDKKRNGTIFVQLSKNERELYISNIITNGKTKTTILMDTIKTADITHISTGINCKHANLCKDISLVFSIIINNENQINFIAEDEKTASFWIDAFNIITGNSKRSSRYTNELDALVEMDLKLQLIELQNITIPKNPPPVPPVPKPVVPPKPAPANRRGQSGPY
ncbi:unnamed protein product [Phyllotreta striolata]|uniref:Engulfment and cell motility protein 1 n=1 Tax=Phyllotreta striolata TaxID=444603 RepID=A0A9N9XQQ7_PHYSR|nr:unnamed protein product [Phyllotreta striolata]